MSIRRQPIHYRQGPSITKQLRQRYGLTWDEFMTLVKDQDYRCLICNDDARLVVDHCHDGTHGVHVRSLLCNPCNVSLGRGSFAKLTLAGVIYLLEHGCDHDLPDDLLPIITPTLKD